MRARLTSLCYNDDSLVFLQPSTVFQVVVDCLDNKWKEGRNSSTEKTDPRCPARAKDIGDVDYVPLFVDDEFDLGEPNFIDLARASSLLSKLAS